MSDDSNPYAAPKSSHFSPSPPHTGNIVPTAVDAGSIISFAMEVWKANLKLLVGITVVFLGATWGLAIAQYLVTLIFEQLGQEWVGLILGMGINLVSAAVSIFLGIGQVQITLKLLRGQPAQFGDLFAGGPRFLPVLGASLLGGFAVWLGFIACIVPGLLLILFFWPFYWLVVDERTGVIESFGVAYSIAKVNVGTSVIIWLVSMGVVILGAIALLVGLLFALPLVSLISGTAYLMMAGLLSPQSRAV
ncbi:MAG: hypothetical protein IT422_04410 [Pirellulaceae bacterium]|jgi:hypothetical protein|nr:hypothetical protein [Pirellulaceae bacterium]